LAADPASVPGIIAVTLLSPAAAIITAALYTKLRFGKVDPTMSLNGALGGLVGITAGAEEISLGGSIIVGIISGIILVEGIRFFDVKLKVDDPVGAIAVHGVCGIWGTVAVSLFSTSTGLFYGYGFTQVGIQIIGVAAVLAFIMILVGVFTYVLNKIVPIRVSREEEISGLDFSEHGSNAYHFKERLLEKHNKSVATDDNGTTLANRLNNLSADTK